MNVIKIIAKWTANIILALIAYSVFAYYRWSSAEYSLLVEEALIADTALGPVEYIIKGESGPIVLYFHGTPGGYDQSPPATDTNRLMAVSRPGYLRTPLSSGVTPEEQANLAAALLDTLNIDTVIANGVSGGGPAAIAFALHHPDRTEGLVLIEAISQVSNEEEVIPGFLQSGGFSNYMTWALFRIIELTQGQAGFIPILVSNEANRDVIVNDPEKLSTLVDSAWALWPANQRINGWANDIEQKKHLNFPFESISTPTLLIHGDRDTNVNIQESEIVANRIPGAQFHIVRGGDHMMLLTHQEEIIEVLEEFLQSL